MIIALDVFGQWLFGLLNVQLQSVTANGMSAFVRILCTYQSAGSPCLLIGSVCYGTDGSRDLSKTFVLAPSLGPEGGGWGYARESAQRE